MQKIKILIRRLSREFIRYTLKIVYEWESHSPRNCQPYLSYRKFWAILASSNIFLQKTVVGCPCKMSAPFASGLSVGVCTVTSFRHKEKTFSFTLHSKFALCLIQTAQVTLKKLYNKMPWTLT